MKGKGAAETVVETLEVDPEAGLASAAEAPLRTADPDGAPLRDKPHLEDDPSDTPSPLGRTALALAFPPMSAGLMAGAIFLGAVPRLHGVLAAVLGVGVAVAAHRIRRPALTNITVSLGLFLIGVVGIGTAGIEAIGELATEVTTAVSSEDLLRPPVQYTPGWRAVLSWFLGGLGFVSAWCGIEFRKPSVGVLISMAVMAFAAMSVPGDQQLPNGLASFVLLAIGLGVLSSAGEEGDSRKLMTRELRRVIKGIPLVLLIGGLVFAMAQAGFLFPEPIYDPTKEAIKPKAVPLSQVEDRVLFTVESNVNGPWRMGQLDVYDGKDWRLPPFAESRIRDVPRSGVIDSKMVPGFKAMFEVRGLEGAVLPTLPNPVGMVTNETDLGYDARTGNIRLTQGQAVAGMRYTITAARLPTISQLSAISAPPPRNVEQFLEMPPAPPAVQDLLSQAPTTSSWARLDFVRQTLLRTVTATGSGIPVSVTPEKVQDMLAGSKEGSPFEIVAGEAMLARWAGVPSRIGYGFDGGDPVESGIYEVRPKHGTVFLEIYLPGFRWLPVIGTPQQAKSSLNQSQKTNVEVAPTDEVNVEMFFPLVQQPKSALLRQFRRGVLIAVPLALALLTLYFLFPLYRKSRRRARNRAWAASAGPHARIAVAYAEWRDYVTDLGYKFPGDTPLMFLDRVTEDSEHRALAWLVTRVLWGDLQRELTPRDAAAAEDLSRSLRQRAARAHPWTLRFLASISRLSIRDPYAPQLHLGRATGKSEAMKEGVSDEQAA